MNLSVVEPAPADDPEYVEQQLSLDVGGDPPVEGRLRFTVDVDCGAIPRDHEGTTLVRWRVTHVEVGPGKHGPVRSHKAEVVQTEDVSDLPELRVGNEWPYHPVLNPFSADGPAVWDKRAVQDAE